MLPKRDVTLQTSTKRKECHTNGHSFEAHRGVCELRKATYHMTLNVQNRPRQEGSRLEVTWRETSRQEVIANGTGFLAFNEDILAIGRSGRCAIPAAPEAGAGRLQVQGQPGLLCEEVAFQ